MGTATMLPTVSLQTMRLEDGLHRSLANAIADRRRLKTRLIDLVAHASDASHYHLIPRAVVQPVDVEEVQRVLAVCHDYGVPVTFRAGGTSLSGQGVTNGVLLDISRHFKGLVVEDGGARVRVEPGVIGAQVNAHLASYGRRIGPDPASIDSCMMGGILANNASGMCCGVAENAFHTISSAKVLLANGLLIDTSEPDAAEQLDSKAPLIAKRLRALRRKLLSDPELTELIRAKYKQKNTTGYSLNALLDFKEPIDMLPRLLVGSEGTLGFIAEARLETLPTYPVKYTSFMLFDTPAEAAAATRVLAESGARAVEFFDRASLTAVDRVARQLLGAEVKLRPTSSALLVEYQLATQEELEAMIPSISQVVASLPLSQPARFTTDAARQALIWKARKGLYPAVGAMRDKETTVMIEDVAVPLPQLPDCVAGLQRLFARHGYDGAIIFGHAKDGNLHFVITQAFENVASIQRYAAFMDDLVELVAKQLGGALKAEHGTGRNIAPFVEAEWGREAHQLMRQLKEIFDPEGLLNPGVIINDNPQCHTEHLKHLPAVGGEVDSCVECGFCEKACPSADLTLTPRQRVVVLRHIERLRRDDPTATNDFAVRSLLADYDYDGIETCAADGLCAVACPVGIDTGKMVKRLRGERTTPEERHFADWAVTNYRRVERYLRTALRLAHLGESVLGSKFVRRTAAIGSWMLGQRLPGWVEAQPLPPRRRDYLVADRPGRVDAILFPSCMSRIMGRPRGEERAQQEVLLDLARRAKVSAWAPRSLDGHCCGLAMSSKGYAEQAKRMQARAVMELHRVSEGGRVPIVVDSSSCTHAFRQGASQLEGEALAQWRELTFLDATEFVRDQILPRLDIEPVSEQVFVHANCAARKLGVDGALLDVARACAKEARIPEHISCCGTAGDRGLLYPELPTTALRKEKAELEQGDFQRFVSSNLTCETGLSMVTQRQFTSFLYLVDAAVKRPR